VKVLLPLWMAAFLWYQWPQVQELWRTRRRHVIGPAVIFTLSVAPAIYAALTPEGMARGRTVAAWTHFSGFEVARNILNNYLSYFDPGLLFVRGGPAVAQSIPGLGLYNLIDLPLVITGVIAAIRGAAPKRFLIFVLLWALLGPLPGGITSETHNIGRCIGWLPAPQLLSAFGLLQILDWISARRRRAEAAPRLVASAVAGSLAAAWAATAVHVAALTLIRYPQTTERDWQFEISRALICAREQAAGRQIVVAPQFQAAEVFALFHLGSLPPLENGQRAWSFGNRSVVPPHEVYTFPAHERRPAGVPLCEIKSRLGGEPKAFVFGATSTTTPEMKQLFDRIQRKQGGQRPRTSTAASGVRSDPTPSPRK
jgi:hypothetical protein